MTTDMKYHYISRNIFLAALGICIMNACDLDQFPQDSLAPENTFRTETELKYYINGLLPMMTSYVESGIIETADNGIRPELPNYMTGKRSSKVSAGSWSWTNLRKINIFFQYSHNCEDADIRAEYEGMAHCLRAWFYYDKLKTFGGVPWYDSVVPDSGPELYKPRDSRDFIAEKILEEIDIAVRDCPEEKKLNEITKWTALALKSRFCLFEGTFRKYHGLQNADMYLEECVEACEELMTSGYTIDNTGGKNYAYRDLFAQPATSDASMTEVILARSYSIPLGVRHNTNYTIINVSGQQLGLNKTLVDSYLMANGERFTEQPGYKTMTLAEECENRDPRLKQTIRTPGFIRVGATATSVEDMQDAMIVSRGYMPIKYLQSAEHDAQTQNDNDIIAYRYAEVLLNFAEAKAELGSLSQQDINRSIKLIRDRVGMPNLILEDAKSNPDPYMEAQYPDVSGNNKGVILEIRRERRIELVMEGLRYDDIMRWKAGRLFLEPFRGAYVPEVTTSIGYSLSASNPDATDFWFYTTGNKPAEATDGNSLEIGKNVFLDNSSSGNMILSNHGTKVWDEDKDYLAPIPSEELTKNPALEQNPGWDRP